MSLNIQFTVGGVEKTAGNVEMTFADLGQEVSLTAFYSGSSPATYLWSLYCEDDSAAVLSSATSANPTFTPDLDGTYLVSLTINSGLPGAQSATAYLSFSTYHLTARIPAPGETTEHSAGGWSAAAGEALRKTINTSGRGALVLCRAYSSMAVGSAVILINTPTGTLPTVRKLTAELWAAQPAALQFAGIVQGDPKYRANAAAEGDDVVVAFGPAVATNLTIGGSTPATYPAPITIGATAGSVVFGSTSPVIGYALSADTAFMLPATQESMDLGDWTLETIDSEISAPEIAFNSKLSASNIISMECDGSYIYALQFGETGSILRIRKSDLVTQTTVAFSEGLTWGHLRNHADINGATETEYFYLPYMVPGESLVGHIAEISKLDLTVQRHWEGTAGWAIPLDLAFIGSSMYMILASPPSTIEIHKISLPVVAPPSTIDSERVISSINQIDLVLAFGIFPRLAVIGSNLLVMDINNKRLCVLNEDLTFSGLEYTWSAEYIRGDIWINDGFIYLALSYSTDGGSATVVILDPADMSVIGSYGSYGTDDNQFDLTGAGAGDNTNVFISTATMLKKYDVTGGSIVTGMLALMHQDREDPVITVDPDNYNVGLNTPPAANVADKISVGGNIRVVGTGSGYRFPDGALQTVPYIPDTETVSVQTTTATVTTAHTIEIATDTIIEIEVSCLGTDPGAVNCRLDNATALVASPFGGPAVVGTIETCVISTSGAAASWPGLGFGIDSGDVIVTVQGDTDVTINWKCQIKVRSVTAEQLPA